MFEKTPLQIKRLRFEPQLPKMFENILRLKLEPKKESFSEKPELKAYFPLTLGLPKLGFAVSELQEHKPLRIGVVLSGGQAAGGHNVITGLFDAMKQLHEESLLFGFINGPAGIIDNKYIPLTAEFLEGYRNQGGFDMIGAGRTKIETEKQFECAAKTASALKLDGLVIIGGDDSNTNAALLAEYFLEKHVPTRVVGVPKTIDGDLKNEDVEISFGFDSATKTFSEAIGNLLRDALSAKKYYFFVKIMGRSASHVALECALQTHPNMTLIGEEVFEKRMTLQMLTSHICDMICLRAEKGKNYGVILIPEGIIEFIPEFNELIAELNRTNFKMEKLSDASRACFNSIPVDIQKQLLMDRDPHGNIQVSKIETERLFIESVQQELSKRKSRGEYKGSFSAQGLFYGYEGRSCYPSNFDSQYCYTLGFVAALLVDGGATGYLACVQNLAQAVSEWKALGIPLTSMMHLEERKGNFKPVIKKALVDLKGGPFTIFKQHRDSWVLDDAYLYPGPIQFFGPSELTDLITLTLSKAYII